MNRIGFEFLIVALSIVLALAPRAEADYIVLTTGEHLSGVITSRDADVAVLEHPVLGTLTIRSEDISELVIGEFFAPRPEENASDDGEGVEETPQDSTGEGTEEGSSAAEDVVDAVTEALEPAPEWKSRIDLGFAFSDGNTENSNLTLSFKTVRDTEKEKTTFDAAYYFAEDSGETSENKATVGLNHDWKLPNSPWLFFARGRFDYDEFNSWRRRITAGGGVGYKFYDEEDFTLTGRAGLVAVREYESDRDDIRVEGLLGIDLTWQIDKTQAFELSSTYFPDLEETGEFRALTSAKWTLNLPQYDGASVFVGVQHEHQSVVDAGRENDDILIYGGLGIEF